MKTIGKTSLKGGSGFTDERNGRKIQIKVVYNNCCKNEKSPVSQ